MAEIKPKTYTSNGVELCSGTECEYSRSNGQCSYTVRRHHDDATPGNPCYPILAQKCDDLKKENAALKERCAVDSRHLREKIYVDMTPNEDLVRRILTAYIEESHITDNMLGLPPESWVCKQMNEDIEDRNKILRVALLNGDE